MKLSHRGKIAKLHKHLFLPIFKNKSNHVFLQKFNKKECLDYMYLTITNIKSIDLLRASLYSLYQSCNELPSEVIIVSDGSYNVNSIKKQFEFWPNKISFIGIEIIIQHFKNGKEKSLANWAENQIWGKKMASILYYADKKTVLFADSDILWFKQLITRTSLNDDFILKTSIDNSINYDQALIKELGIKTINKRPPVNCGVVFIKGKFFDRSKLLRRAIDFEAKQPGPFSEQTIFAMLVSEFGSLFTLDEIESKIGDSYWPIIPNYKKAYSSLYARHYLWVLKWMFWRDFYFIFVKKVKQFS